MKCSKCNHENGDEKKFCEACGERLIVKCTACGAENPLQAKFCEKCGEPLNASVQKSTEPPVKPVGEQVAKPQQTAEIVATSTVTEPPKAPEPPGTEVPKSAPATQAPRKESKQPEPAANKSKLASAPSTNTAQISAPVKKGSMGMGVLIAGVVVIGAGAYLAMKPSANDAATPPATPQTATQAVQAVTAPVAAVPPAPVSQNAQVSLEVTAQSALPHLRAMLDGAKNNNDSAIQAAVDAIKQLSLPPKGNRKEARAANDEGVNALKANALDEAIAKFKQGVAADSSDQEIINNLGHTYLLQGKHTEAIAALNQALTLAPTRSAGWVNLATAYANAGKREDSVAAYLLAFNFSPNQQKTRAFIAKQAEEDPAQQVRDAAGRALEIIGSE